VRLSTGGRLRLFFQKKSEAENGKAVFGENTVDNRILSLAANVQRPTRNTKPSS